MNPLRKAIHQMLREDETLTDLLSEPDAIFHREAPEGSSTPYIIFNQQAGTRQWAMQAGQIRWPLWLVKGVDRSEDSGVAEAIAARVDELLTDSDLSVEGFNHLYLRPDSDVDYGQPDSGGMIHHVGAVYRIALEPA